MKIRQSDRSDVSAPGSTSSLRRARSARVAVAGAAAATLLLSGCGLSIDKLAGSVASETRPQAEQMSTPGVGDDSIGPLYEGIPDVVADLEPSVVSVLTGNGEGSGVVWSRDGLIVTNNHVVQGTDQVEVAFADGQRVSGEVRATDPLTDIAVVEVGRDDLPAATFAETLPRVGELAIAMGNPLGFENSVTAGIVSGLSREIPGSAQQSQSLVDLIQTDAAISPGNSGGALVNGDGEVIGINVAYIPPNGGAVSLGFAIPAPTVVDVVEQLVDGGSVRHAFFGVRPGAITPAVQQEFGIETSRGVLVMDVVADGPAEAAGLEPGDIVTAVDGDVIESVESFLSALRRTDPGDTIEVAVVRDGRESIIDVTLADRPTA